MKKINHFYCPFEELTRDIAVAFNSMFDTEFFPQPEPQIQATASRVMSLRDGSSKMSKSDASDATRINLTDSADDIAQKIKRAKTDPEPLPSEVAGLAERPEATNLVGIFAGLSGRSQADILSEFGGQGFGVFKPALAELAVSQIAPISAEMNKLLKQEDEIDAILEKGATQAQAIAAPILSEVKKLVGFS